MDNLWSIVGTILLSFTGMGALLFLVVKLCSNTIADRLLKRYQHVLDKKTYISKLRFDTEFAIYKSLSGKLFKMSYNVAFVLPILDEIPPDLHEKRDMYRKRFENAVNSYNAATSEVQENAPFIPLEIYTKFEEIRRLCCKQLVALQGYFDLKSQFIELPHQPVACAERKIIYETNDIIIKNKIY